MRLSILAFGQVAEITGSAFSFDHVSDTDALKLSLEKAFPALQYVRYTMAVDKTTITANTFLKENAVVALLPPFSGG
ncbi:MoaD/ThiS family protein [Pinibacter soli]|uniref:MoaD/ThiS family protein n=1 Tax=Pinibacter soli TaxID=3044211 RepID=A0ABT6RD82_9BACT|nr:MoaD/ThiS family protein [Pinibacter soli]MDI3320542.1 MoaD/ThiS family protein [Pinibacter soli]